MRKNRACEQALMRCGRSKVDKQRAERCISKWSDPGRGLQWEMRACTKDNVFQIQRVCSGTQHSDRWKMTGPIEINSNYQKQTLHGVLVQGCERQNTDVLCIITANWLAQLVEHWTTVQEVWGSSPRPDQHSGWLGRICCLCNDICKWLDILVFSDKDDKP